MFEESVWVRGEEVKRYKKNVLKFFFRFVLSGSSHQVKVLAGI